ncbi:MAG: cobalt-precorrin-6A reductase [Pseudomonadota bacterium]
MTANLLILGGTTEATALAGALAQTGVRGTVSFAGRVARPARQPLPQRVGGFGGPQGLAAHLEAEGVTHLIDATHPFAAQMSANAVAAAEAKGVPLIALTRPPWAPRPGDRWIRVPSLAAAAEALARPACTVLLAVGRVHLNVFAGAPQHRYVLRLIDPPASPPPFPDHRVLIDRGPFDAAADRAMMAAEGVRIVVSKNSGGTGAYGKIEAARALGLPVILIDRPAAPPRREAGSVAEVMDWLDAHAGAERGV